MADDEDMTVEEFDRLMAAGEPVEIELGPELRQRIARRRRPSWADEE